MSVFAVKPHHGTPTFFRDGTPEFYGLMWGSPPTPEGYALEACARKFAEAGVHRFTFDMGTYGTPPEWRGSQPGKQGQFDFSTLKPRFERLLSADPEACFHLRVHLEMPEWWQKLYPEERELASDGKRLCQSFASTVWREQAKEFLRGLAAAFEEIGLSDRILAYQCGAGGSGEWVKGPSAMGLVTGDYSLPMQRRFQAWLRGHYQADVKALQAAWAGALAGDTSGLTFENARVPPPEAQFRTMAYTFRDPVKEQPVIDYYRCLADLCGELLIDYCSTVKEASGGKALAGAFYGYLMELAWNAGFFGEGVDSEYSTTQRSGHLGLGKVLQSPAVDFLVSPYSYGFRGIGGEGCAMPPSESLRLHNKLYIFEDDTRTHLSGHDHPNYGKSDTLAENLAILQRNFAYITVHGQGIWWLGGGGPQSAHIDLSQEPAFIPWIKRFQEIGAFALELDRRPSAQVAVLLDDESFYYESLKNSLDLPLIFQQRLWGLPHMGAPFDVYLLDDLLAGALPPYKLYIFLNPFRLDDKRREALKSQVRQGGRVALWIYAPGYINKIASLDNMADLTGMTFGNGQHPWGPMINLLDFTHPITQGLPQDLVWGTNGLLGPVFHGDDPQARTLGNVVYSQGRCRAGFMVKEFPEWTSIYSAAPNLPAAVLRGIARFAGVHIYSEAGDVLYAGPELLALHTAGGGKRALVLPGKVERVFDLYQEHEVTRDADRFEVVMPPASSALFYTGSAMKLKEY